MKTLPLSEAKARLNSLIDDVQRRDEEIVITRNGRPVAVLLSPDEVESWKETLAIRSDTELMEEIRRGLKSLRKKKARLFTLDALL